jgi:hypothetical protein
MSPLARAAAAMMIAFAIPVPAEEPESEAPPSLELLEFLAEWETEDGEWVDPALLEDKALDPVLDKDKEKKDE